MTIAAEVLDVHFEETTRIASGATQNYDFPVRLGVGWRRGPFLHVRMIGHNQRCGVRLWVADGDPGSGGALRLWKVTSPVTVGTVYNVAERIPAAPWVRVAISNTGGGSGDFPVCMLIAPYLAVPNGGR